MVFQDLLQLASPIGSRSLQREIRKSAGGELVFRTRRHGGERRQHREQKPMEFPVSLAPLPKSFEFRSIHECQSPSS
jgi:hypothetical protein